MPDYFTTTLAHGPEYDNYRLTIVVKIIDDTAGVTTYTIPTFVTVQPDIAAEETLLNQILNSETTAQANKDLFSGDLRSNAKVMASLVTVLNSQSFLNKSNAAASGKYNFHLFKF